MGYIPIDWTKAVLTYIVPYLVSIYTSVVNDATRRNISLNDRAGIYIQ